MCGTSWTGRRTILVELGASPRMRRLRELGRAGLCDLVARCCRYAHQIVSRIGALPDAAAVCVPQINQGLVRFLDPRPARPRKTTTAGPMR